MRSIFVAVLTVLVCACAKSTAAPAGSQTHFLESCEESCPDPYACYCGVCTVPCSDSAACEEHSGDAQCVAPASSNADACSVSMTICDVECEGDSDCVALSTAFECSEGRCRESGAGGAGEGGSGGTAGSGGTGGTGGTGGAGGTTADAGSDADGGAANMGVICDGSDDVRLGYTSGGGQVDVAYDFTNPYGHAFFFVDGQCRYYVSSNLLQGVHSGTLTEAQSEQLADDVRWGDLATLGTADSESCPDAGLSTIWTRDHTLTCTCGCDEGPLALLRDAALAQAYEWISVLETQGASLAGPLSVIAYGLSAGDGTEPAWPLEPPMTEIESLIQDIYGNGIGEPALFDDPADAAALRALREAVAPTYGPLQVREAGTVYLLYMRDELPVDRAAAITAFIDGRPR